MKNPYVKILLIVVSLIQVVSASDFDAEKGIWSSVKKASVKARETISFFLTPTQKPTWPTTLYKATTGASLMFSCNMLEDTSFLESYPYVNYATSSAFIIGANILFSATGDTLYLLYDAIQSPRIAKKIFGPHGKRTPGKEATYNQLIEKRNQRISHCTRAGLYLINSLTMTYSTYRYANLLTSFVSEGINPFALAFPEDYPSCTSSTILCRPLTTPIFLALNLSTLIYNLRELSFFTDPTFSKRGDVPFFSYVNGFSKAGISAEIARLKGLDLQTLEALARIKNAPFLYEMYTAQYKFSQLDRFLQLSIRFYGTYQVYEGAILTFKNIGSYFKRAAIIEEIREDITKNTKPEKITHKEKSLSKKHKNSSLEQPVQENKDKDIDFSNYEASSNLKYIPPEMRVKTKKRGTADPSYLRENLIEVSQINEQIDYKAQERERSLESIRLLRQQYPIKDRVIEKAINDLQGFLSAEKEKIDGNECRLVWYIGTKRYSLKYETAHGKDSSNYEGNKLDRILNMLEVGYLIGLNEEKIHSYIKENNRYNILRFPKFVTYLFMNSDN